MLHLYIGEENLPKDMPFIDDPSSAILTVVINGNDFQRRVLNEIEKGEYYDGSMFTDRFGGRLYYTEMSSGSKSLFVLEYYKDRVINCIDCGDNALGYITYLKEGHVYLPYRSTPIDVLANNEIYCNGKVWSDMYQLNRGLL